jgi:VanZ family protein
MKLLLSRWLPVLIWAAVIFSISAIPAPLDALPSEFSIKLQTMRVLGIEMVAILSFLIHLALYLVLGCLSIRAFVGGQKLAHKPLIFVFLFCMLYALSDEGHQLFVQGRGFEWIDLLADGIGVSIGMIAFTTAFPLKKRPD